MSSLKDITPYVIRRPFRRYIYDPCVRFIRHRRQMNKFGVSTTKYACEVDFWQQRWDAEEGKLKNAHYEKLMLAVAGETDQRFVRDKIVADFGCGPRGSLQWAKEARIRIGVDVLADVYTRFGTRQHDMCYVISTEDWIPLPTDYVDVLFTTNAMDHVYNFPKLCEEVRRIIAPGGTFVGAFNLGEPRSLAEPQMLTEELIDRHLLKFMDILSYRIAPKGLGADAYKCFFDEDAKTDTPLSGYQILGVRATLKSGQDRDSES